MRVCVDPGHGGSDPGAIGLAPSRLEEKEFNLAVALLLEEELIAHSYEVIMTRRIDRTVWLSSRAEFANRFGANLFISIHANAAASPAPEGMEVFNFPGSVGGNEVARSVLKRMLDTFPDHRDRGVKEANFLVLRKTLMPAILVECEFLTNPSQLRFLSKAENRRLLACAIAEGVSNSSFG